ncbi:MAG TPA: response regulator [Thermomicrobiales bacterium]|nr:response regulator [Thermomicrobiales bacterium]
MQARVLLIEDDLLIQDLLREILEEEGYRVLVADATLDPVDVSQLRPSLVLLDLWFGGAAWGLDWLRELRVTPGARCIPVIVCTADARLARREAEQLQTLAADLILKPFDLDDVVTRVAAGLSSRSTRNLASPVASIAPRLGAD